MPVTSYTLARGQDKLAQVLPAYCSVEEFLDDLETLRTSLAANRRNSHCAHAYRSADSAGATFGLHLHTLDIRQHARVLQAALQEAISDTMASSLPSGLSR